MEREWHAQFAELNDQKLKQLNQTPRYNLVVPRSACPHCGHMIGALENIPVISYLLLARQMQGLRRTHISARYPIVELVSGLLSGFAAWHFGFGLAALGALAV